MINYYSTPFDLGPLEDEVDVEVAWGDINAPWLDTLIERKHILLKMHLLQHVTENTDSIEHHATVEALKTVSDDIIRGYNSLWS